MWSLSIGPRLLFSQWLSRYKFRINASDFSGTPAEMRTQSSSVLAETITRIVQSIFHDFAGDRQRLRIASIHHHFI